MSDSIHYEYQVSAEDFTRAGEASSDIKSKLKRMGVAPEAIRKVAIAMYEGEINMVIHANGGKIFVDIRPNQVEMQLKDNGPGIPNIDQAMQEGFSTAPEQILSLGFGAGMGLPNMRNNTDEMHIDSTLGMGTTVTMRVNF
ncbi:MAG: ATP-binding protein [Lachnospiraceae bacterium]